MLAAIAVLWLLMILSGRSFSLEASYFWPLVLSSCFGIVMGDFFLFAAMRRLGPRRTKILFATNAPIATCLGWFILGEGISFEVPLSLLLGFLGVVLATMGYVLPNFMALCPPEGPSLFFAVTMLFFVAPVMVPVALIFETLMPQSWPLHIWQSAIWPGLIATGLAFCLRFHMIRNVGAG